MVFPSALHCFRVLIPILLPPLAPLQGCVFDKVLVYKPATSKPANSEVYVVGKGFRGVPSDVLELLLAQCGEHDIFKDRWVSSRYCGKEAILMMRIIQSQKANAAVEVPLV